MEVVIYVEGQGDTDAEVINSAESIARDMDIYEIAEQLLHGYGVMKGQGEIEHIRENLDN